jgi:ubiquitin carboxyl-terminal hydrolase 5/13
MASVLQMLFSLPGWRERYGREEVKRHEKVCEKQLPGECLECQIGKVADGLGSGRYSVPSTKSTTSSSSQTSSSTPVFQEGIRPVTFKHVIGKGHAEFGTMRQQDAEEFFGYLMQSLRRELHRYKSQGIGESLLIPLTQEI